jgi:uncharacterized protein
MTIPAAQSATAALLARLSGGDPVETPLSAVFVGADTVWKLRKAVELPFIDFTPLAARERAARRELELNRVWAPGLYRDLAPVTAMAEGGVELNGAGETVDYVVRMARIPHEDFLEARAASAGLSPELLDDLADMVAAMHDGLPAAANADPTALIGIARGNLDTARRANLPEERIAAWGAAVEHRLSELAPLLADRAATGCVRRCHGDLHLANLCLFDGRPTAFDALEFREDMATIDTGYDLAFLLMDLDLKLGRPAANRVMNRYLARRPDIGMLAPMPIFLSLRALIRAHVCGNSGRDWRPYLDYAEAVLAPPRPVGVGIGGLPGTGKTTVARAIAPRLGAAPGAVVLRSDEIRKRLAGVAPEQRLPEAAYSRQASEDVARTLLADFASALACGHSAIADLTFLDPAHRRAAEAACGDAPFFGFWLTADPAVLRARIAARRNDASDATIAVLEKMLAGCIPAAEWQQIDTDRAAPAELVASSLRAHIGSC